MVFFDKDKFVLESGNKLNYEHTQAECDKQTNC